MNDIYTVSFFCYYPSGKPATKRQEIALSDIGKWVECYRFTHPACTSVSITICFEDKVK